MNHIKGVFFDLHGTILLSDDVDTVVPKGHLTKDILKSGPVDEETAKVVRLEPEPVQ